MTNLLAEADGSNNITNYYVQGLGLLALITPSNSVYTYHFNNIGSTIAITDSNQAIVNKYSYDPFGVILNQVEAVAQPFKYVGQFGVMQEPNGFYYMRARYYDPKVGRFVSEDPIGFRGKDANLMRYVKNRPVTWIDPSGLFGAGGPGSEYPGHADFYTGDWDFDYNLEDTGFTQPFPVIGQPGRHFRPLTPSEHDVANAIASCNKEAFERAMHRGQDYFSHYGKGFGWDPGNETLPCNGWGHGCRGTEPDEDNAAWAKAEAWTQLWVKKWNEKCECKK